jgi:FemAB-related protein (PEP-CTERM system-associated)
VNSSIEILQCGDTDQASWDAFIDTHPGASFYHRFAWRRINEQSLGHRTFYLAARRDGRITGIFPLVFINSRLFGRIFCSMPFVNYGGPCADDDDTAARLLDEAIRLAQTQRADYAEFRALKALPRNLPTSLHKLSMTVKLARDPDILWNAFTSKHRKNVRRIYKNDLRVVSGHLDKLDEFYDVLVDSWREHGTPIYRRQYFRDMLTAFPEHMRVFVTYQGSTPVAVASVGYHHKTVEGLWLGTHTSYRELHPSYVMYWEMIKDACERGFDDFHLGRSTAESGAEFFKERWNAEAKQLYWSYYLPDGRPMPQLNVDNPRYRLAIKVWRKLPKRVTTWLGPPIARCIP